MKLTAFYFAAFTIFALFLAGCGELRDDEGDRTPAKTFTLPDGATVVAEGAGDMSYKAEEDGRIYVYDMDEQGVVGAKRVRAGQFFKLSPDDNVVTLDGRKVAELRLKGNHQHRLYFEKE